MLPVWRRDGREWFFVVPDGTLMATDVTAAGTQLRFASPTPLFRTRLLRLLSNPHEYDVSPDGQRFLIGTLIGETDAAPPTVILNWTARLEPPDAR